MSTVPNETPPSFASDPVAFFREQGRKGGSVKSAKKKRAARKSLKKARAVRSGMSASKA